MKKISKVAITALFYVFFIYSFSFFDSIGFFENLLYKLGFKATVSETVYSVGDVHTRSIPDPPFPPPPPP
jgi:hypothetical protein